MKYVVSKVRILGLCIEMRQVYQKDTHPICNETENKLKYVVIIKF
jgi:hypothetical protein